jgi:hypothetical protein
MKNRIFALISLLGFLSFSQAYAEVSCPTYTLTCAPKDYRLPREMRSALTKNTGSKYNTSGYFWEHGNKSISGGDIQCQADVVLSYDGMLLVRVVADEKLGICINSQIEYDSNSPDITNCFQSGLTQKFKVFEMWATGLGELATCEIIKE